MRQARLAWMGWVMLLGGCDDYIFGVVSAEDVDVPEQEGFLGVKEIIDDNCLGCHDANQALGGLDLETDLYGATVDVVGQYNLPLVLPGDPERSMLYTKVTGTNPEYTGADMPPGSGGIAVPLAEVIYAWIADGALPAGEVPVTTTTE